MQMAEQPALWSVAAADRTCQLRQKPFLQAGQLGLEVLLADLVTITQIKGAKQDRLDRSGDLPTPGLERSPGSSQRRNRCAAQVWCAAFSYLR